MPGSPLRRRNSRAAFSPIDVKRFTRLCLCKPKVHPKQCTLSRSALSERVERACLRADGASHRSTNSRRAHGCGSNDGLRERKLDLAFVKLRGNIQPHGNIMSRGFNPERTAAGVTVEGTAKYTGLHSLRHFFACWCHCRDGGLELPVKVVQERLGRASITMTMDVHQFNARTTALSFATAAAPPDGYLTRHQRDMETIS
jgi:hypothetical protein